MVSKYENLLSSQFAYNLHVGSWLIFEKLKVLWVYSVWFIRASCLYVFV